MSHTVDGANTANPKLQGSPSPRHAHAPQASVRDATMATPVGVSRHVFAAIPLPMGIELNLKLEGLTPGGSIKDKAAKEMLEAAISNGAISPGTVVLNPQAATWGWLLPDVALDSAYDFVP